MAIMIPSLCDPASVNGEQYIFRALESGAASKSWVVFHSMKLGVHPTQLKGEADFVALIPKMGVLVMEIKSYSGQIYEGYSKGRRKDPFEQVWNESLAIRDYIYSRSDLKKFRKLPFACLVVYPFGVCEPNGTAYSRGQFADASDFGEGDVSEVIFRKFHTEIDRIHKRLGAPAREASADFCGESFDVLKNALTSYLGFKESPQARVRIINEEITRYTDEQDFLIKCIIPFNPRTLVTGLPGTGKTISALETADIKKEQGKKTLFLCESERLKEQVKKQCSYGDISEGISGQCIAATAKQLSEFADTQNGKFQNGKIFDFLITDEAQESLKDQKAAQCADKLLKGGFENGMWAIFGDISLGNSFLSEIPDPNIDKLRENLKKIRPAVCNLFLNCRNPKEICQTAYIFGDPSLNYELIARPNGGEYPIWKYYNSEESQSRLLADTLRELEKRVPNLSDIAVLSPKTNSAAARLASDERWKDKLSPNIGSENKIRYSRIDDFASMESMAVVITDLNTLDGLPAERSFSLAAMRSKYLLRILADAKIRPQVAGKFAQRKASLSETAFFKDKMFKNLNL